MLLVGQLGMAVKIPAKLDQPFALLGGQHQIRLRLWQPSTGTLALDQPSSFTGQIAGIQGSGNVLDLAGFDAAKQKNDVETILAKKPSAILALPLDPVTSVRLDSDDRLEALRSTSRQPCRDWCEHCGASAAISRRSKARFTSSNSRDCRRCI